MTTKITYKQKINTKARRHIIRTPTHILYTWCIPPTSYVDRNLEDASISVWVYTFHMGNTSGQNHRLLSSTSGLCLKIIKLICSNSFFTDKLTIMQIRTININTHTHTSHTTTRQHAENIRTTHSKSNRNTTSNNVKQLRYCNRNIK